MIERWEARSLDRTTTRSLDPAGALTAKIALTARAKFCYKFVWLNQKRGSGLSAAAVFDELGLRESGNNEQSRGSTIAAWDSDDDTWTSVPAALDQRPEDQERSLQCNCDGLHGTAKGAAESGDLSSLARAPAASGESPGGRLLRRIQERKSPSDFHPKSLLHTLRPISLHDSLHRVLHVPRTGHEIYQETLVPLGHRPNDFHDLVLHDFVVGVRKTKIRIGRNLPNLFDSGGIPFIGLCDRAFRCRNSADNYGNDRNSHVNSDTGGYLLQIRFYEMGRIALDFRAGLHDRAVPPGFHDFVHPHHDIRHDIRRPWGDGIFAVSVF